MKKSFGFNLIEMAMVLLIVGFLMRSLLIPLPGQIDQKKIVETRQYLEEIKEALLGFAVLHGRLPEPDLTGTETKTGNGVANPLESEEEGDLPWASLGVGRYDAWGNSFRYRVRYDSSVWNPDHLKLVVTDAHSDAHSDGTLNELPDTLIELLDNKGYSAIIFSKGKNGKGDGKIDEEGNKENNNFDEIYAQGDYVESLDPNKHFDDILIWLPKNIVVNRLVTVGKWPP
jgi:type II secretory pathway pseudopilin PulG